jgi:hypothetical protein
MTETGSRPKSKKADNSSLHTLAWRIFSESRQPVIIEDTAVRAELELFVSAGILLEDGKGFCFCSEDQMIEAAASYIFNTEISKLTNTPNECFERLHDIWRNEIGEKDMVSGRVLALLHNREKIDAYSWGRQAIENGINVFDVLHLMESAVEQFEDARAESIYHFFSGHYESVKNDLAGGLVFSKLQRWFAHHPTVAREIVEIHEDKPEEHSGGLYGCAVQGLIDYDFSACFDLALEASKSSEKLIAGPAIAVLGRVDYSDLSRRQALSSAIEMCNALIRSVGHPLIGTAVRTLCRLVLLDEDKIVSLLAEAGKAGTPEGLYSLSEFLWMDQKEVERKAWFWPLVFHLTAAKAEHRGIVNNVDRILSREMKDEVKQPGIIKFLNAWITQQPKEAFNNGGLEVFFQSTVHRITERPAVLSNVITEWLLNEDSRFPLIVQQLLSRLGVDGISSVVLDPRLIDSLTESEILFLLRRILGYIVGDEMQIELVFSLVHTQNAEGRTFGYIISALLDHVGYDYPYQTLEFLKARQGADDESEEIKTLCRQVCSQLQARIDELDALPDLKEFHADSVKMLRFAKERRHQMNEAMEEASKESIWRQICTHIPLKAGRRTFQTINGRYTDPMELKEMSHTVALPKSEVTDPAGAAHQRMLFRMAKKVSA